MEIDKIHCIDCLEGMKYLADNSIDLIVTDPPYYIAQLKEDLRGVTLRKSSKNNIFFNKFDHFDSLKDYKEFIHKVLQEFNRLLKDKGQVYMFFSYHHLDWVVRMIKRMEFRYYKPLIWYKSDTMGVFPNQYGCNYEVMLWFRKRGENNRVKLHIGCSQRDVFNIPSTNQAYRAECGYHPTPKPAKIIRTLIKNGSDEGDLVLDPFMGSGTTAVACTQTKRHFIGFETQQEYIDIANRRLAQRHLNKLEDFENGTTGTDNKGDGREGEDALYGDSETDRIEGGISEVDTEPMCAERPDIQ